MWIPQIICSLNKRSFKNSAFSVDYKWPHDNFYPIWNIYSSVQQHRTQSYGLVNWIGPFWPFRIGIILVQAPRGAQLGFGTKPHYKAPGDLRVEVRLLLRQWLKVGCGAANQQIKKSSPNILNRNHQNNTNILDYFAMLLSLTRQLN